MTYQPFAQPPTQIWAIILPVKGRIIGAIALAVLSTAAGLGALLAIIPIAANLLSESPQLPLVWRWLGLAVALVAVAFTARILAFDVSHRAAFKLEVILRTALTEHLARLPLGYVITTGSGAIKKLVQDDVKSLHAFVADSTPLFGQAYATPLLSLVIMLVADWRLGLITLAVLPAGMAFVQLAKGHDDQVGLTGHLAQDRQVLGAARLARVMVDILGRGRAPIQNIALEIPCKAPILR